MLLAAIATRLNLLEGFVLWLFLLGDWALMDALPRCEISFGPAKPTTMALALLRLPALVLPYPLNLAAETIGTLLVVYAFWIEPQRLTVSSQKFVTDKLLDGTKLRVLHFGDLHVERITGRERRLVQVICDLAPDLILFSGDFLNVSFLEDPFAKEGARAILRQLRAPLGVFAVIGSPVVDQPETVAEILKALDMRWLRDETTTLVHEGQAFDIVGVSCSHKPFVDAPRLRAALLKSPSRFRILLYHSPDLAPDAAAEGIDLQLSGHTHGGQVRVPFFGAIYTGSLYGKLLEVGRREIGGLTLYVTRGVGLEGMAAPRVRFLCPPEIVLWEIQGRGEK